MMKDQGAFGIVTNEKDEVLLVQLPEDFKLFPKAWNFPGGVVNGGEEPANAAMREVLEETAVTCEVTATLDQLDTPTLLLHFYRCRYLSGQIEVDRGELIDAGWFTKQEALSLNLAFDVKQRIEKYL